LLEKHIIKLVCKLEYTNVVKTCDISFGVFSKQEKGYNVRYVSVPGGGVSKAVYFPIVMTELGQVKLSILAQAANAGDAIEQTLLVEPEGYRVDRSYSYFV